MGFGNLAAQHEPNAGPCRFGREEGYEQVRRVGQSRTVIIDMDGNVLIGSLTYQLHVTARFNGGINGVAHQVDKELLELIRIGVQDDRLAR
jgi:hypothetical protein